MRTHAPLHRSTRPDARRCLVVAAALALAACDDAPVTAPPQDGARLAIGALQPVDEAIDLTDTWIVAEATTTTSSVVQYDTPTWDPVTGATTTQVVLPKVTETQRTEAGYGADGVIRIHEYFGGDSLSGVAHVQVVGDSVAYFDAAGRPRLDLPGAELIATLGSFRNDVVTDSIILRDEDPADGGDPPADPLPDPAPRDPFAPAYSVTGSSQGPRREIASDIVSPGVRGRQVRYYRRASGGWVLDEERRQLRQAGVGSSLTTTEVTRYHKVSWRNDLSRDAARRAAARAAGADAGVRREGPSALATRLAAPPAPASQPNAASGPQAALTFWLPEPDSAERYSSPAFSVALQHGAFSSATTWSTLAPAITEGFNVDVLLRESLDWKRELESQAQDLRGRLAASGRRNFLVVGHSNGGLVARRAAQLSAEAGDSLVRGVVTIASAHAGLPLAKVGRETVHGFLTGQLRAVIDRINGSCWRGQFAWLCETADLTSRQLPGQIANFAMDAYMPMSRDVQPGSPFLSKLNAAPETFRRYSIEVSSQGQWKFLRLFGDWRCDPGDSCGGNRLQNTMESVYEILRVCGSNALARMRLGHVSDKCRDARWTLSSLNAQYERWVAAGDESDGLIPLKSQQYPGSGSIVRYTRRNTRDSHAGELRSTRVKADLIEAMKQHLAP